ncbi:MAG: PTS sugar transporter subunit IIC/EAL domain-containing protein, partial [Clostridia bacterium]|nr:PTS sugar transporter subunit IIC/EAL domain-containing protein [Clostridia bacterium]
MANEKSGLLRRIENSALVRSVRDGLVNIIPVLIIGAFALILNFFPVKGYQDFIATFAVGILSKLFVMVNSATFGPLSVYMTISISRSYISIKGDGEVSSFGAITASVISFFILAGAYIEDVVTEVDGVNILSSAGFRLENIGPKAMFLALITGLGATCAYSALSRFLRGKRKILFSSGANRVFNTMLSTIFPIIIVVFSVAVINLAVINIFGVASFRELMIRLGDRLFSFGEVGFFKGFFFVLLSSILWMFGIHGSDTLEDVMSKYFTPGIEQNMNAVASGGKPTVILTKQFFDCFVLMGGCGATICLLIAIAIFSRNHARRGLAYTAAFPMIFNINELMVFGIPIVFNPVMLIPFLTVPLVCYTTSYIALSTGIVPLITHEVEWTTPIILGGYTATGSVAGALLQIFNVILGVLIYMPFVKLLDKRTEEEAGRNFTTFLDYFRSNEAALASKKLTDIAGEKGEFAKGLSAEIMHAIKSRNIILAYQPQYNYAGDIIGVEALLRYSHPVHGVIYPPLVIKIAEDGGFLAELEASVVKKVLAEREKVYKKFGDGVKISFNITGNTIVTDKLMSLLRQLDPENHFEGKNLCVEVTEQAALTFDDKTRNAFEELHKMGFILAIDDFSMGQTSLNYLKDNMFDIIKLDGSLVKGLSSHANCREIIESIVRLSKALNLTVLAEYVETDWDRQTLHELGCDCYQGYLYSPA